MARLLRALLLALVFAGTAQAQDIRYLNDKEAVVFRGVGRLNIYGSRFCTATLISDRLVLTAAHCLFSPISSNLVKLHGLEFVAGQRGDTRAAARRVTRMVVLPGFKFNTRADLANVASDIALLELEAPIKPGAARPLPVRGFGETAGLRIVSYSRDRPLSPSTEGPCAVLFARGGVTTLRCAVTSGASGAPVLVRVGTDWRVVAVVSAMGNNLNGAQVALTVPAAAKMAALKAALAKQPRVDPGSTKAGAKAKAAKAKRPPAAPKPAAGTPAAP